MRRSRPNNARTVQLDRNRLDPRDIAAKHNAVNNRQAHQEACRRVDMMASVDR